MQKIIKNLKWFSLSLILGLVLGGGLIFVKAWTEPTLAPPDGNLGAPINTSSNGQAKAGGLLLNSGGAVTGLIVQNGNVGIGDATPDNGLKLDVEGNVGATQYCDENGANCLTMAAIVSAMEGGALTSGSLIYGQHTQLQCTSLGGTVVSVSGNNVCKFTNTSGVSCPSGWAQYNNWSTTIYDDLGGSHSGVNDGVCEKLAYVHGWSGNCSPASYGTCNYSKHSWSNLAQESCALPQGTVGTVYYNSTCSVTSYICRAKITEIGCY